VFQPDGRLALVVDDRAQAQQGGHGVEQPAAAGGDRAVESPGEHLADQPAGLFPTGQPGPGRRWFAVSQGGQVGLAHAPGLPYGRVAAGKPHRGQMGQPDVAPSGIDEQGLTAPDRAVLAEARAVQGQAQGSVP